MNLATDDILANIYTIENTTYTVNAFRCDRNYSQWHYEAYMREYNTTKHFRPLITLIDTKTVIDCPVEN